jgi:1-acyl-sn-glycerol-3-phosphate acyltransferase
MPVTLSSYPNSHLRRMRKNAEVLQQSWIYRFAQIVLSGLVSIVWRVRVFNRRHEPTEGGVLYVANHQSFLDPILVAYALQRPMNFMARDTLFKNKYFARIIETFNAFPVRRGTGDIGAIKESLRRLKSGHQLIVFPEGTRTNDGHIQPFKPGPAVLAQRGATWVVPVLIDGAELVWPKGHKFPTLGNIVVQYGEPIHQSVAKQLTAEELTALLRNRIIEIQHAVRRRAGKSTFDYSDS